MAESRPPDEADGEKAAFLALARSLSDMRDVLLECSMMLQDAYFACALQHRDAAAEDLKAVIQKITVR